MGKRGPKPGPRGATDAVISIRMQADLLREIEAAARSSRRTLSDEIRERLWISIADERPALVRELLAKLAATGVPR